MPRDAGIVSLDVLDPDGGAPLASVHTSVRFGAFPASGMAVMIVAGLLLFGGAALGLRSLLAAPQLDEPPST